MDGRSTEPARATRRAILLGGVAAAITGVTALSRRDVGGPDDPSVTGASVGPIAASAAVSRPARRLGRPGRIRFPVDPVPSCTVLDNFGQARSGGRTHEGVDILTTLGQQVYAVAGGVLIGQTVGGTLSGNAWGLLADDGQYYYYAHLATFATGLARGSRVQVGDVIGTVGDTGNPGAGNYHLHFEIHPRGFNTPAVDPLPLLDVPASCRLY